MILNGSKGTLKLDYISMHKKAYQYIHIDVITVVDFC